MRILIADDDPITLDSLAEVLQVEGFDIIRAADGEQALDEWRMKRPDLVCLDIMMPRYDGYEVCKQIRATDSTVPVLFLSAKSEEIDVVVGLKLGADDFIRKPFGKNELLARIHSVLRRSSKEASITTPSKTPKTFVFGDLTVYPHELRATSERGETNLTPRELKILQLLSNHMGEVISRDVMLDHCWGIQHFPESRTLDQHIAKLRKKIEVDVENPRWIETVRGVGYRYRRETSVS